MHPGLPGTEDSHETANSLRSLHEQSQGSRPGFIKLMHSSTERWCVLTGGNTFLVHEILSFVLSLHTVLWFVLLSACLIVAITDIIYTRHLFDGDDFLHSAWKDDLSVSQCRHSGWKEDQEHSKSKVLFIVIQSVELKLGVLSFQSASWSDCVERWAEVNKQHPDVAVLILQVCENWAKSMGILCGSTGVESILVRVQAGKDVISRLSVSQSTSSVWDRATGRWSLRQGIADFTGTGRMMAVFRQKWSVPVEANITGICMMHRKFSFLDSLICKDAMELVDRHFSVVSAVKTQG